jgi:hypothetical protein
MFDLTAINFSDVYTGIVLIVLKLWLQTLWFLPVCYTEV